jgi:hypothetical protein
VNDAVIRIVRGQASDEECVAILMAVLMSACRARPPLAAAAADPPARAPWASGRQPGYTSPGSWQSP